MSLSPVVRSLAIGAATGLRTTVGPAAVLLRTKRGGALPLSVIGELIVDKLPATPARTNAGGLLARGLAAAFAGSSLAQARGGNRWACGGLAVAGAVAAAYAGVAYRRLAVRYVPDLAAAVVEDGLAIGLAWVAAGP